MRQAAARAPDLLRDNTSCVVGFLRGQIHDDGGFCDRNGVSDLYYTTFGIESLATLGAGWPVDRTREYLYSFGSGEELDFVHRCCLARCWANAGDPPDPNGLIRHIEENRSIDGGYNAMAGSDACTAYDCFLALGAYQDLRLPMPDPDRFLSAVDALMHAVDRPLLTPILAATVTLRRELGRPVAPFLGDDLRARHRLHGGFVVAPGVPIADLLSTATALHALSPLEADLSVIREPCLDFLDTLWSERGGFCGSAMDSTIDCEYTYYGLLALGHLSA